MVRFVLAAPPLLALVLVLSVGARSAHAAMEVLGLRFGDHGDTVRVVIDLSRPSSGHQIFTLSDPHRIVIDLPDVTRWHGPITGDGLSPVKAFRSGRFDRDTVRIVLDAKAALTPVAVFSLLPDHGKPARLVVDLKRADGKPIERTVPPPAIARAPAKSAPAAQGRSAPRSDTEPSGDGGPKLIVLDAGHGGVDPGAIAIDGQYEKNVALAMARLVRDGLQATGRYDVVMTRDSDIYLPLRERVAIARREGADLFISLHADSINRRGVRGASIYTLSESASDAEAAKLAARENRADIIAGVDLGGQQDEVADILLDLAMRDTKNQSKRLANMLVNSFADDGINLLRKPHRYAGFAVLKAPDVPSVLVEMGYLSNRHEAKLLRRRDHQRRLAGAIIGGVDAYFSRLAMAGP